MIKRSTTWKTKGMNRDLSVSAFSPEYSFENINLRLATKDGNTLMSWVNERGTKNITPSTAVQGIPIGTAVINQYLIVFTTTKKNSSGDAGTDRIYRFKYTTAAKEVLDCKCLYEGDLNLDAEHPLETLVSYETKNIQKVYWVDGKNQPRVINIAKDSQEDIAAYNKKTAPFDFITELSLQEKVKIYKDPTAGGVFSPGVIQYAFTYYQKNGQESNFFYVSPLLYVSHKDRGASPEDKVSNAFKITIDHVDKSFDYIRVYSLQRTSLNSVPYAKRVVDLATSSATEVEEEGNKYFQLKVIDNGTIGDTVDPTELLYKGGSAIIPQTMEQKDGTLFFGNYKLGRRSLLQVKVGNATLQEYIKNAAQGNDPIKDSYRHFGTKNSAITTNYQYFNQLTAYKATVDEAGIYKGVVDESVPCGGFKCGEWYRCGIQFQYKDGSWSEPAIVNDHQANNLPIGSPTFTTVPVLQYSLPGEASTALYNAGYRKARALVVFPKITDRRVLCQGVVNSTMYTDSNDFRQSSWFFRPGHAETASTVDESAANSTENGVASETKTTETASGTSSEGEIRDKFDVNESIIENAFTDTNAPVSPIAQKALVAPTYATGELPYTSDAKTYSPVNIRQVEIQGIYDNTEGADGGTKFKIDNSIWSFHTPDLEYEEAFATLDFSNTEFKHVGNAVFTKTLSAIDITTSSPAAKGTGFKNEVSSGSSAAGIISGLFYDDYFVDDVARDSITTVSAEKSSLKWMVYLWHRNGSLNNDMPRGAFADEYTTTAVSLGSSTAVLKKKVISNLRYSYTAYNSEVSPVTLKSGIYPQLFSSEQIEIIKSGDTIYYGNVDALLYGSKAEGFYFASCKDGESSHPKYEDNNTTINDPIGWKMWIDNDDPNINGIYRYDSTGWEHLEEQWFRPGGYYSTIAKDRFMVRMKYKSTPHLVVQTDSSVMPYGSSAVEKDGLKICEIITKVDAATRFGGTTQDAYQANEWIPCGEAVDLTTDGSNVTIEYSYGDTYFQRWDCLKTYPFTLEDINQVVEIGSFMLETRINIDGRYDRNRGLVDNTNVSNLNFNLFNPVYSQTDNFFNYRIMPEDYYKEDTYKNQITWTKTKQLGAETDAWTNITLASTLDLDGDKGAVTKLIRLNDQLLAFQDTGIAHILYNEKTQVSTSEGVPIELQNSGKVTGKSYVSDTIGCHNKWSMARTPFGIYFIDSFDKSINLFSGELKGLSTTKGFDAWSKQNIKDVNFDAESTWTPANFEDFIAWYDKQNQEILFINDKTALAWSEKLQSFTSFYSYGSTPFFCNVDGTGIWVKSGKDASTELWQHQTGKYGDFFGTIQPYSITLIGNPELQVDKTFTNLEFRACVSGDNDQIGTGDNEKDIAKFFLPFDYLETWNEYQHGKYNLKATDGSTPTSRFFTGQESPLRRKYRIWSCDIPRDNVNPADAVDFEKEHDIYRTKAHPLDRMRNPWLYLKLEKTVPAETTELPKTEIHDLLMDYMR